MTILIDGHNLIGSGLFPDIDLSQEDDEAQLVARLKVWRSRYRGGFVVIFDRGVTGGKNLTLSGGGVEVIFAASPTEADDLIRRRLRSSDQGLILVSNDASLRREAQTRQVTCWSGAEFAARLGPPTAQARTAPPDPGAAADVALSAAEVDEWLALFGKGRKKKRS